MKSWTMVMLLAIAMPVRAEELKKFDFKLPTDNTPAEGTSAECAFTGLKIPEGVKIYAAGNYSGREVPFQIDQSGHQATQFDIAVNSPHEPVALILGAYEPTIWNIGWSKGTTILAVMVSGYHRQAVAGITKDIPVLNSSYDNKGPCGYFYMSQEQRGGLNPLSRRLFNKPVDLAYVGDRSGKIAVGEPLTAQTELITSSIRSPESFRDPGAPLAGPAGVAKAVEDGVLRRATAEDVERWTTAVAAAAPPADVPPIAGEKAKPVRRFAPHNAYVVLKEFTYPSGLYGAHSATFFIRAAYPGRKASRAIPRSTISIR